MDAGRYVVWYACVSAWVLWLPAAAVAVSGVLRRAITDGRTSARTPFLVLLVTTTLLALWFLVPFPYGSSTASNLTARGPLTSDFYKGAASRALLYLLTPGTSLGAYGTMVVARLHVIPLAFLGLALLLVRRDSSAVLGTERSRTLWLLLLLLGPGVMMGMSNGKYYGSLPLAGAALFLALELRREGPRWLRLVLLPTSLWLVALSRPESVLVSAVAGAYLLWAAIREHDRALAGVLALVMLLLVVPLLEVSAVLDYAVRNKSLLMGPDTLGAVHWTTGVPRLVTRIVLRTPLSAAGLFLASGGLLWLALVRAASVTRDPRAVPERVAAVFLLLNIVAAAVHRDGFGVWIFKYSMVAAVPIWYLSAGALDVPHVRTRLRAYRAVALSLAGAASLAWVVFCVATRAASVRQTTLDLHVAPQMARFVCQARDAPLLAFQTMDGEGERALLFTDRSPLDEFGVVREVQRTCGVFPARQMKHQYTGARGYDPAAFLCAPSSGGSRGGQPAKRAIVSLAADMTVAQLVAAARSCGWSEGLRYGNVTVLGREAPGPPR